MDAFDLGSVSRCNQRLVVRPLRAALLASVALKLAAGCTWADTVWTGVVDDDWSNPANWSNGVPSSVDQATINSSNVSVEPFPVVDNVAAQSETITVGDTAVGLLHVQNGGVLATGSTAIVGNYDSSISTVRVTDAGSQWNFSFGVIGNTGHGQVVVQNGGLVSGTAVLGAQEGMEGVVIVTGNNSQWNGADIVVGDAGIGQFIVSNGGAVGLAGDLFLGREATGGGIFSIWDATSSLAVGGTIEVGLAGNSTLNVLDGATATSQTAIIGAQAEGNLLIGNGGSLATTGTAFLGYEADGIGNATVTGDSSTWTQDGLQVGRFGEGNLLIADGGQVTTTATSAVGWGTGSKGRVTITGGGMNDSQWVANLIYVGGTGEGEIEVNDGAKLTTGEARIGHGSGNGSIVIEGKDSAWNSSGTIYAGDGGSGTLRIRDEGDVVATAVNVGTYTDGIGVLSVSGNATLTSDTLLVGEWAGSTGMMFVEDGGLVFTTGDARVGVDGFGRAVISGTGSEWNVGGNLSVGSADYALLSISDSAAVAVSGLLLVDAPIGRTVSVEVSGAGTTLDIADNAYIGGFGNGNLTLSDGALLAAGGGIGITVASETGSTGTFNIGAAAGESAAVAGILTGTNSLRFGAGSGVLNFNHANDSYVFGTQMIGFGTINHLAGTTNLLGNSSGFTGTTNVTGGGLYVNTTLGGIVEVNGGTLGGTGTLSGPLTVRSGGTLAPGNSIGTLNVADATLDVGSVYAVELNDGGFVAGTNNDFLNATGAVAINGGTVHVTAENGTDDGSTYTPGTYTIITSAGGVIGEFSGVSDNFAFLSFALSKDTHNVYLTSSQATSFCLFGMTANQCATGDGVFSLGASSVFDAVLGLSDAEAPVALDLLSGEIHASEKTALIEDSRFVREAAISRLSGALGNVGYTASQSERAKPEGATLWVQGFGSRSNWASDGNAASLDHSIGGFFIGGDTEIASDALIGLVVGYSSSALGVDDRSSSSKIDTYTLGAYAGGTWDAVSLKAGIAHSWHSLDTSRSIAFTGFSDNPSTSYKARTFQAFGEAAFGFEAGNVRLEPYANLAHVRLSTEGFSEAGGAAALTADAQTVNTTFATIGLRAEKELALAEMQATLSGGLGWRHAFGAVPTSTHAFAAGGSAFTLAGVPLAQDTVVLDVGLNLDITNNATLGLTYNGQFGSGVSNHAIKANLGIEF